MNDKQLDKTERYLRGELQNSALEAFERELSTNEDFAREVEQHRQANLAAEAFFHDKMMKEMMIKGRKMMNEQKHQSASDEYDTDTKDKTPNKVITLDPARKKRSRMTWLAMVASLLIILSVAGWQFGWLNMNTPDPVAVINTYYPLEGIANTGLLSANNDEVSLQNAIQNFENKDYQNALLGFNELLADPNFQQKPRVLFLSGIALTQLGETNQAVLRFGDIPASARTFYLEGQWQKAFTLWKGGNETDAIEAWSSIAEDGNHPRQAEAQTILKAL